MMRIVAYLAKLFAKIKVTFLESVLKRKLQTTFQQIAQKKVRKKAVPYVRSG